MSTPDFTLEGLGLKQTCAACPEAYDVYDGEKYVGYMRLRHGSFTVRHEQSDEVVYQPDNVYGDGAFSSTEERDYHMRKGLLLLRKHMRKFMGREFELKQLRDTLYDD